MSVRSDLPFLRARSLRSAAAPGPAPAPAQAPTQSASSLDLGDDLDTPPPLRSPGYSATEGGASLDLGGDLDTPPPLQSPHEVSPPLRSSEYFAGTPTSSSGYSATEGGASLDLGGDLDTPPPLRSPGYSATEGGASPHSATGGGTSLSLDAPSGAPVAAPTSPHGHSRPPRHDLGLPAINADERRLLTEDEPVVELTRMQSAAGSLEAKVAVANSSEVVLGMVFETSDDRESLVLPGLSQQGPDPRRPIFRATSSGVAVNLRRVTDIHRMLLFAVPTRPSKQMPGGTVTLTTYGGSRCEIPLVAGPTLGAQALISCYVVEGRLVLRAEHDPYSGTLQQVCAAYGYRELSWRDPYTPLV